MTLDLSWFMNLPDHTASTIARKMYDLDLIRGYLPDQSAEQSECVATLIRDDGQKLIFQTWPDCDPESECEVCWVTFEGEEYDPEYVVADDGGDWVESMTVITYWAAGQSDGWLH